MVEAIPEEQREYICVSLIDGSIVWHKIGNKMLFDNTAIHQQKMEGKDIQMMISTANINVKEIIDNYKKSVIYQTRIANINNI